MRPAIAMIELVFAIVIIAISVVTIPVMINIADKTSQASMVDDDVMARLAGWTIDKYQARWDANYAASGSSPLWLAAKADLNCARAGNYRMNPVTMAQCDPLNRTPSEILNIYPNGNVALGIERLNGGSETITIPSTDGKSYGILATYGVRYVNSDVVRNENNESTTWKLGSSSNMNPDGSQGADIADRTHLKRIVTRFSSPDPDVDITLTFFKSNKGN